ncbi:arginine N-succinyltransferase [Leeia sp. TBRC 13508]|uniref:Arginine N-succinyltransferase n=1 Tax=Leeia speluncae TaxID=2884804 RepID=A0ABS8D9F9_9NEIS|nr:arginine N-succinyltransferase [Leeia speluncae]MCB6184825.1 arginine N-succinyltransferase [Leeia speluncae]
MLIVRPSRLSDLAQVERMASASGAAVHTLPAHRDKLFEKISASVHSFDAEVDVYGEESYFFVLENTATGVLHGTSAVVAYTGFSEPFYVYRNDIIVHASRALKVHNRIHVLTLSHDLTGDSQLCSFYVDPELAKTHYPRLLSRARLLFAAQHPERFADNMMSFLPGVSDATGRAPFWEGVGRKFFGIDYVQAEYFTGVKEKTFIAELMPHYPIYVPLLSDEAQQAMGQVHPGSRVPFNILLEEGFEADNYIEIFDGGPVIRAKRENLKTIQQSKVIPTRRGRQMAGEVWYLVSNTAIHRFRAMLLQLPAQLPDVLTLASQVADALELDDDDEIRIVPM